MTERRYPHLTDEMIKEARQLIGVELRRYPRWTTASEELIVRFALAIGSRNSLYLSRDAASTNMYGGLVAHPTLLYAFDDTVVAPRLPGIHTIYAGTDWEWYGPVLVNDRIAASARLIDVQEKYGQFCGRMVLQVGEVTYTNQMGQVVATARPYVLRCPRDAAQQRGKYLDMARHRYTPEELAYIDRTYEEEGIRGQAPRYWEDTQVGEEVPPIVKGPLSSDDMLNFIDVTRGTLSHAYFLEHWRRHPADVYWDPETGMPDSWDASLVKEAVAREIGFPFAHDTGYQRVCWLENLVTNWMGDLAFLKRLSVRLLLPNFIHDTTWCHGRVAGKRTEDGQGVVDLEVWCQNQRGQVTARGTATMALVCRDTHVDAPGVQLPRLEVQG